MSEQEKTNVTVVGESPSVKEIAEKMCHGAWRLRPNIVVRVEDDGGIIFDPDTDMMGIVNRVGTALLRWRPERICYDEWREALANHYKEIDISQIQADVKNFLVSVSYFSETCDEKSN